MDQALQSIGEALLDGLTVIIIIAIGAIVTGLRAWVIAKAEQLSVDKSATEAKLISDVTASVVKYIDQAYGSIRNDEKARKAKDVSTTILKNHNVSLDEDEINTNIEAAVSDLKAQKKLVNSETHI